MQPIRSMWRQPLAEWSVAGFKALDRLQRSPVPPPDSQRLS